MNFEEFVKSNNLEDVLGGPKVVSLIGHSEFAPQKGLDLDSTGQKKGNQTNYQIKKNIEIARQQVENLSRLLGFLTDRKFIKIDTKYNKIDYSHDNVYNSHHQLAIRRSLLSVLSLKKDVRKYSLIRAVFLTLTHTLSD